MVYIHQACPSVPRIYIYQSTQGKLATKLTMRTVLIAAVDNAWGIGKDNKLPWPHNKEDLEYFKMTTMGHVVIMGSKTWDSLPQRHRPLKGRMNIVISSTRRFEPDAVSFTRLEDALDFCRQEKNEKVFIIGGGTLYNEAIRKRLIDDAHITLLPGNYQCDTFIDRVQFFNSNWRITSLPTASHQRMICERTL